jgi:4-amino-4-deoxy-L-arabinose transferase-like glycosyltransferase
LAYGNREAQNTLRSFLCITISRDSACQPCRKHLGEASGHHHPFYYYLVEFPIGFLPGVSSSYLPLPMPFSKAKRPDIPSGKALLFVKSWFIAGFVFLSVASTKRTLYLMPILAPASMLIGLYINSMLTSESLDRIGKVFLVLTCSYQPYRTSQRFE